MRHSCGWVKVDDEDDGGGGRDCAIDLDAHLNWYGEQVISGVRRQQVKLSHE